MAADAGGSAAPAMDHAAASVRERARLAGEIASQASAARASALVIGVLPAAFLAWSLMTSPATVRAITTSTVGVACLIVGALLEVVGLAWMRRLVRSAA
jgi:tight adherence protein B